jgi:hypothetical protein
MKRYNARMSKELTSINVLSKLERSFWLVLIQFLPKGTISCVCCPVHSSVLTAATTLIEYKVCVDCVTGQYATYLLTVVLLHICNE